MKAAEQNEIIQYFISVQKKVKQLELDFSSLLEEIQNYKTVLINTEIEVLETEKKRKWKLWK